MKYQNLHMIFGPMYSGKSRMLIQIYNWKQNDKLIFKPKVDTKNGGLVKSRDGVELKAISLEDINEIYNYLNNDETKSLFFDETFMFKGDIEKVILDLLEKKYEIFISTLDLNFKGFWFENIKGLFQYAYEDNKYHLFANCNICGNPAMWSLRIIDDKIAGDNSPTILVDNNKSNTRYETRCGNHRDILSIRELRKRDLYEGIKNSYNENYKKLYKDNED